MNKEPSSRKIESLPEGLNPERKYSSQELTREIGSEALSEITEQARPMVALTGRPSEAHIRPGQAEKLAVRASIRNRLRKIGINDETSEETVELISPAIKILDPLFKHECEVSTEEYIQLMEAEGFSVKDANNILDKVDKLCLYFHSHDEDTIKDFHSHDEDTIKGY